MDARRIPRTRAFRRGRFLSVFLAAAFSAPPGAAQSAPRADAVQGPLAMLAPLTAAPWTLEGEGFSTTLAYRWLLPGSVLEATNDVRGADGRVIARYRGAYFWDGGLGTIVFWTAGESGEVHRGRAWWSDGVLWHEAEVSGGRVGAYASAVRPGDGRLEYFAAYGEREASPALLAREPMVYTADPGAAAIGGPLAALAFMAGCWRGELGGGASLEEFYTAPSGGLMLGTSRHLRGGRAVQFGFTRIAVDSAGVVLLPFPGGVPSEHGFRLTSVEGATAVFEAPEHDFPKRILYSLAGDGSLVARIDGGRDDPRAQEWRMRPVRCAAP
jgi:hypothetical protein